MVFPHVLRVFDCAEPMTGSQITSAMVLPSASLNSVGVLDIDFAAQWLARAYPCQHFTGDLTDDSA
jgi:hypothetical protein